MQTLNYIAKKTGWVWGGNYSSLSSIAAVDKCLSRSTILSTSYNKRSVVSLDSPSSGYGNTRLPRKDDINVNTVTIKIHYQATTSDFVKAFSCKLFLSNSSSSTTETCNLKTADVDKINAGTSRRYTYTVTLPNLNEYSNPISRDSYVCATITSDWYYSRNVYFGVKNTDETSTVVSEKLIKSSTKTGCTGNFGIKWRELAANNYTLYVKITPN
jgi:hypothetical protein